ncbi:MAG: Fic family protein [Candidatus Melainabacteria bacterium]|nr:Fic family protein [Candidatus Melainabacteria bacterium]
MLNPQFNITQNLLTNIKQIAVLVAELNNKSFPKTILLELEKTAREISSHSSTSIEGNPLPLTVVKKILKTKPENIRDSEQEVLNYNLALEKLNKLIQFKERYLSLNLVVEIQRIVTYELLNKVHCGKIRKEPVFVNDPRAGKTLYWPPDHQDVEQLLDELIKYISKNERKIDPLILAGIFHKQFVIIHPFIDGNGRTVRLITKLILANMGLNTFNLFSFENYYNQNITKYFQKVGALGNYYDIKDKLDFTEWLEYFTDGIINELLRVGTELKTLSITPDATLEQYHKKLLEYIKKHGYINDKLYSSLTDRAKATRSLDFQKLINLGMIERFGKGKATYYKLKQ